jgi:predicted nucleic acid-binding protein
MDRAGVVDTCVCVDLWHGRLLAHLHFPNLNWLLPDVVASELKKPAASLFAAAGMAVTPAVPEEVDEVIRLRTLHRKTSLPDLFALAMAKRRGAVLLSGDRDLRVAAEREGVSVHGTLWVLDGMELGLSPALLRAALEAMVKAGARLPADEVEQRLARWGGRV